MEAVRFIVDTLLWLVLLVFVLRFILQLVRADFRDPFADAIVRATNWLILPLRRLLPPIGKVDTATVVAILLIAVARSFIFFLIRGLISSVGWVYFSAFTAIEFVDLVLKIYLFALFVYALSTFVAQGGYAPGVRLLAQLCEPVLKPIRRFIPPVGKLDLSVLWASIAICALLLLLHGESARTSLNSL